MRRAHVWIGFGAIVLALGVGLATLLGGPRAGTAVIGDEAPAILDATGWVQALPVGSAAVTVVSVSDWGRLRYIADMSTLCGESCTGDVGLVRILALRPGGSRKVVFVNLAAWQRHVAGEDPDWACLGRALVAEQGRLGAAERPACAERVPQSRTRYALPFDLGVV